LSALSIWRKRLEGDRDVLGPHADSVSATLITISPVPDIPADTVTGPRPG